jgi:WD40 repeat protein
VAFSSTGTELATTGDDGLLKVWRPPLLRAVTVHEPPLSVTPEPAAIATAFSPDGSLVGAIWGDGFVQIANSATGHVVWRKRLAPLPESEQPDARASRFDVPADLAFSPDQHHFAVAFTFHDATVFDLRGRTPAFALNGPGRAADQTDRAVSWSPDGTYLATTSADGTPRIWDGLSGRLLYVLNG